MPSLAALQRGIFVSRERLACLISYLVLVVAIGLLLCGSSYPQPLRNVTDFLCLRVH